MTEPRLAAGFIRRCCVTEQACPPVFISLAYLSLRVCQWGGQCKQWRHDSSEKNQKEILYTFKPYGS